MRARAGLRRDRVSFCFGQAADLAVAQAVKDEAQQFAGRGDAADVLAPPVGDSVMMHSDEGGAALADDGLDRGPSDQPGALLICGTGSVKENLPRFGPASRRDTGMYLSAPINAPCRARRAVKAGPKARPEGQP